MRLTVFALLIGVFQGLAAGGYAQATKLNVKMKDVSVKEILGHVEEQSEFFFLYNSKLVDVDRHTTINADNLSIAQLLDQLFAGTGISYQVIDRQIVLSSNQLPILQPQFNVSGKVTDSSGAPLPGVTVAIKGTSIGTVSGYDGSYSLNNISSGSVLVFSFVGMKTLEINVGGKNKINVSLTEETIGLNEIVVTALGIEKSSKSLTYTAEKVSGDELVKVLQPNMMNSLGGKVAGMTITRSAAGLGGSVKVLLRGSKSIQGNNQPLYIVDGVPLMNRIREVTNATMSIRDEGDGISNLNPDDIESISVLKGASAASLYGSQAANGVILITTKKGKAGITKVDFTSGLTIDQVAYTPKLQSSFGETSPGSEESWGAPISNAEDIISGFFRNGSTWINSIAFSSGNDKMQTYLSYSNTSAKGVVENNSLEKHNIKLHESARFFNDKLKLDADMNVIFQKTDNNPIYGFQNGPLYGLYTFPRGRDFSPYKEYQKFDPIRNLDIQNWPFITADNQNPYWVMNKVLHSIKRTRGIVNITARYDIADWLNIQLRGNIDNTNDIRPTKYYAGTAPAYGRLNGAYYIVNTTTVQKYGDVLLNFNHSFGKVGMSGVLGSSVTDSRLTGEYSGSNDLWFANIFTIQNMKGESTATRHSSSSEGHEQLQAVFGNLSLSYNNWLYLDVTGRNDWSSNLSYTPNGSYFYPSAGLGILLHELATLPQAISFTKLRGSYSVVGNTVPLYVTNPQNDYNSLGRVIFNNTAPFTDLKPEKTRSLELGAELKFFQNQFSLDFTYYKTNSINQFFSIAVPPGTGYSRRFVNGGNIQNSGIEVMAGYNSLPNSRLGWSSMLNFSTNKNEVIELTEGIDKFVLAEDINNYFSILTVGGSYGDIYAQVLKRDEATGKVIIGKDGAPIVKPGAPSYVGNANPDFKLGWNNTLTYKNISLSFLVDGSFGGKVMSLTEQILDGVGVSKASGDARLAGGVTVDGITEDGTPVTKVDAMKWYKKVGGRAKVTGEYMYDATNVRVREVSLGYTLPASIIPNGFVKNARISLVGRNLAYLYKKAPHDPEITFSTGNGVNSVDVFSLPATRSLGFNLSVSF